MTGRYGTLGQVFFVPNDFWPLNTSLYVRDFKGNDPQFAAYFLRTVLTTPSSDKAAVPGVNRNDLHVQPVRVTVDVDEQKEIASLLSRYDDQIENNRRRTALLEQLARELYREWFARLRFPGYQGTRITNGLPEGWQRKRIAEVCQTTGGGTPSTKRSEYWNGNITWVVPTDVTNNDCLVLLDSARKITEKGLLESSTKMVPAETILMTSRASVGYFAMMDREACTNQGFINIVPHDEELRLYLLFNLMDRVPEIRSNARGTTYPEISKGRFRKMDVVVPRKEISIEFSRKVSTIILQVRCLKRSVSALTNARDLLLPRLMSGEIAV